MLIFFGRRIDIDKRLLCLHTLQSQEKFIKGPHLTFWKTFFVLFIRRMNNFSDMNSDLSIHEWWSFMQGMYSEVRACKSYKYVLSRYYYIDYASKYQVATTYIGNPLVMKCCSYQFSILYLTYKCRKLHEMKKNMLFMFKILSNRLSLRK